MADEEFVGHASSLITPLDDFYIVDGDLDSPFPTVNGKIVISRAVYVGVSGDLEVVTKDGRTVIMIGVAAGVWHAMRLSQINSAGTSATDILVGW